MRNLILPGWYFDSFADSPKLVPGFFLGHIGMRNPVVSLWADEEGAEVAEWIVVVALLVAVGVAVYFMILQPELQNIIEAFIQAVSDETPQ
jgi:Flp pilus assembly pilin Flp